MKSSSPNAAALVVCDAAVAQETIPRTVEMVRPRGQGLAHGVS